MIVIDLCTQVLIYKIFVHLFSSMMFYYLA